VQGNLVARANFSGSQPGKIQFLFTYKKWQNQRKILITDQLSSALSLKNSKGFWRTWKSKFKIKSKSPQVNSSSDNDIIANLFAENISEVCTPNSLERDVSFKENFFALFHTSKNKDQSSQEIGTEAVDKCIASLKRGKAPDINNLTAEHFQLAHPCIVIIVCKLFAIMFNNGCLVPDGFGCGLSFPIPKVPNKTVTALVEDFRIITICPV